MTDTAADRPDGLHCVYGRCQGIPYSPHPCHPGCYFQASVGGEMAGLFRTLSGEKQAEVLAYDGEQDVGNG